MIFKGCEATEEKAVMGPRPCWSLTSNIHRREKAQVPGLQMNVFHDSTTEPPDKAGKPGNLLLLQTEPPVIINTILPPKKQTLLYC